MPPAVALPNYISGGILWRIFSQTGIFAGFSLHLLNLAVMITAAVMAWDIIRYFLAMQYFLGCRIAHKGAMDGARGEENYISKPLSLVQWKNIRLWHLELGPEEKLS